MIDFIYLLGTVLFFALMLAYVLACEALGKERGGTDDQANR